MGSTAGTAIHGAVDGNTQWSAGPHAGPAAAVLGLGERPAGVGGGRPLLPGLLLLHRLHAGAALAGGVRRERRAALEPGRERLCALGVTTALVLGRGRAAPRHCPHGGRPVASAAVALGAAAGGRRAGRGLAPAAAEARPVGERRRRRRRVGAASLRAHGVLPRPLRSGLRAGGPSGPFPASPGDARRTAPAPGEAGRGGDVSSGDGSSDDGEAEVGARTLRPSLEAAAAGPNSSSAGGEGGGRAARAGLLLPLPALSQLAAAPPPAPVRRQSPCGASAGDQPRG